MSTSPPPNIPTTTTLVSVLWGPDWSFSLSISIWLILFLAILIAVGIAWKWRGGFSFRNFEIDQADIGVGKSKFSFRPNTTDRQVAYAIWVELSTRKVGLPIDLDHDVIAEIYDSWYEFFSVTRDLVKTVPVAQVKRRSTQAIIKLSIEVLNEGLRPHLTHWQARFRKWYEREVRRYEEATGDTVLDPQQIQSAFPKFEELKADMIRVNQALIKYRAKMRALVLTD